MKTTKIISTMCAVLIALVMSACGETSQSSTESKAEVETTTTATIDADIESETTTTTTALSDEPKEEVTTTTKKPVLKTGFDEATNIIEKNGGLIYHIPNYFQKKDTDNNAINYSYTGSDGSVVAMIFNNSSYTDDVKINEQSAQKMFNIIKESMKLDDEFSSSEITYDTILDRPVYQIIYTKNDKEKNLYTQIVLYLIDNEENKLINMGSLIFVLNNEGKFDYDYVSDVADVFVSIEEDKDYVYEKTTETKKDDNSKSEEISEETYEHNSYYDVIEGASWTNRIGSTHIIHKVKAKQDVSISATMLAYSESGSVIGKSSSDIVLTAGQSNYFEYTFSEDVSNAQFKLTYKAKKDSYMTGERNGVELVEYSVTDENLYLTLKQTIDELGSFAKYKILFYNGDQITDTERGYFSVSAENLDGKGSTDVAEIWTYGTAYDRIEFIYEP